MLTTRTRDGLTLVEILVVLAILGIAGAAIGRIGVGQQAHYRDFAERVRARAALREGSALLSADLRGIASAAGDLYAADMRDASIAFRSTVATLVLCTSPGSGASSIDVVDAATLGESIRSLPAADGASVGDSLWLYDSGSARDGADDRWHPAIITSVSRVRETCAASAPGVQQDVYRVGISSGPTGSVEQHAPLRLFRRVRYALYQSSDGLWYLGYSDCRPIVRNPPCASLQPVSGPYEPYSAANNGAHSGLHFSYLDAADQPTTDPADVASIVIALRARTTRAGARPTASAQLTVALRNTLR